MEQEKRKKSQRDGKMDSPWQNNHQQIRKALAPLYSDVYDAIIIGGGLTGLTTALLLQLEGKKCIILEAKTIGFGTTGGTSAHINTFFDATYTNIEKNFGKEAAKLVAESGKDSLELIRNLIKHIGIACEYETKEALLFSENESESIQLDEILESSKKAGIEAEKTQNNGLPIPFHQVIKFHEQGQFHPLKYLSGLAKNFIDLGGLISENLFISDTGFENGLHYAESPQGRVWGHHIVHATHLPQGISLFNFKCAPYRSYVIAAILSDENYPQELIYDMQEPYHYFRTHLIDGKKHLLVGGEDHKTGHHDPEYSLNSLISYVRKHFNIKHIPYKWSSQYYVPADGLPYIGHFPGKEKGAFVATGFNGNGITFGTLSAKIISDVILGYENRYADLYNPSRIKPLAEFGEILKENADVAWHFVADRFFNESLSSMDQAEKDSGKIIHYKGHEVAVYKDKSGKLHLLNATCTHAGCIVNWNSVEKSWDCPCHGARFDAKGHILTGPAQKDLQQLEVKPLE